MVPVRVMGAHWRVVMSTSSRTDGVDAFGSCKKISEVYYSPRDWSSCPTIVRAVTSVTRECEVAFLPR